jgi:cell division protease FtsH
MMGRHEPREMLVYPKLSPIIRGVAIKNRSPQSPVDTASPRVVACATVIVATCSGRGPPHLRQDGEDMSRTNASESEHQTDGYSRTTPGRPALPTRKPPTSRLRDLKPRARFSLWYYLTLFGTVFLVQSVLFSGADVAELPYNEFRSRITAGDVDQVVISQDRIYGRLTPTNTDTVPPHAEHLEMPAKETPWRVDLQRLFARLRKLPAEVEREKRAAEAERKLHFTVVPLDDPDLLDVLQSHGVTYRGRIESRWLRDLLYNWIVPFGLMFLLWGFLMRRLGRGQSVLSVGQSKAKIYEVDPKSRVRFQDLAGVDEAIQETREVVDFLSDPRRFKQLGAKLPKGVLLVGPPGTGKTLLARAIAGESHVPFFSLSGSDFVEMFVGVGAARVRDLFEEAKKAAPCIIFIDELDAIGKSRAQSAGIVTGGYDERENTLNQLLVEMDGFDAGVGVVILAATNRPEILDPALLRPGRFDRRVVIDRPGREGRKAIFRIHTRKLPLAPDIDFQALAAQTAGMVGADIANVCNEAALLASRTGRTLITMVDFQEAVERAIAGPQKKSRVVSAEERQVIAFHESGHALVGHMTPGADPVQKISIIPRAQGALGYTLQMPLEDRYLLSRAELLDRVRVLLAGRASEDVVFGAISTGASDDLEKASQIVRDMLTVYGMSRTAPNLSLVNRRVASYLGGGVEQAPHSDELAELLDKEVIDILRDCYEQAKSLLQRERRRLDALAHRLLLEENLDRDAVLEILGPRPSTAPWQDLETFQDDSTSGSARA